MLYRLGYLLSSARPVLKKFFTSQEYRTDFNEIGGIYKSQPRALG